VSAPHFGAITYSERTKLFGSSRNQDSQEIAESLAVSNRARQSPAATDCRSLVWFDRRCGAQALSGNGPYGSDQGNSLAEASRGALNYCRSKGGQDCKIVLGLFSAG
jgi:Domain of unknown function (DUF4189)